MILSLHSTSGGQKGGCHLFRHLFHHLAAFTTFLQLSYDHVPPLLKENTKKVAATSFATLFATFFATLPPPHRLHHPSTTILRPRTTLIKRKYQKGGCHFFSHLFHLAAFTTFLQLSYDHVPPSLKENTKKVAATSFATLSTTSPLSPPFYNYLTTTYHPYCNRQNNR